MIWLVWRQHRRQLFAALIGLAVLALALVPTGLSTHKAIAAYSRCVDALGTADFVPLAAGEKCDVLAESFGATHESWAYAGILLLVLPLLVGLFWGAPLVAREVEHGTHRLVWTQGITRRQWALTKVGLVGATVVVLAAVYSTLVTWWMEPLNDTIAVRFSYIFFDQQGVVPVAYTVFAVAVGIFAGTVVPRVLPAMATTLVAFLFARIAIAVFVRPNIRASETRTGLVAGTEHVMPNPAVGNWITETSIRTGDGRVLQDGSTGYCVTGGGDGTCNGMDPNAFNHWTYQPGGRFWLFQWVESSIYVVLSVALLYLALRRIQKRLS
ncbi:ABC transporter permease [Virgisporangium ochraceum]|uniref:Transporter n=1 Tax=Virgisporangium ochraceum TaxID=65505 RepID=A0A8J3ZN92_9ACTN|nr:transporter [Virgisporangium ochraceum]GIJ65958.1 transporter [Virgisporangium ochraceum]